MCMQDGVTENQSISPLKLFQYSPYKADLKKHCDLEGYKVQAYTPTLILSSY